MIIDLLQVDDLRVPQALIEQEPELSVVLPCLNEAETLGACLTEINAVINSHKLNAEVIVADNGSTDRSPAIAIEFGARLINVSEKGYGNALLGGIRAAKGRYVVMGDADFSYDFGEIPQLLGPLRLGYELVMGNRFRGTIYPNAMPVLNRYLGNPVLTAVGRVLFRVPIGDFHCGLRGFSRQAALDWQLSQPGMEFASEMIVKAALSGATLAEVPVSLRPDGRSRPPHLRPWRDGWRHLRLMGRYFVNSPVNHSH